MAYANEGNHRNHLRPLVCRPGDISESELRAKFARTRSVCRLSVCLRVCLCLSVCLSVFCLFVKPLYHFLFSYPVARDDHCLRVCLLYLRSHPPVRFHATEAFRQLHRNVANRWSYWWKSLASYSGRVALYRPGTNMFPSSCQPFSRITAHGVRNRWESLVISNISLENLTPQGIDFLTHPL